MVLEIVEQFLKIDSDEIEKKKIHFSKKAINNVGIEKISVSDEFAFDTNKEIDAKYFIGYKTDKS